MDQMKTTLLIICWLAALATSAQTNSSWRICRNPARVFGSRATVDLTPLFQWWARQPLVVTNQSAGTNGDVNAGAEEERPLSRWYRVTGTPVSTTGFSWMVDAVIYTSPTLHTNAHILLHNPPVVELERFNALKALAAEAEQQINEARHEYETNLNAKVTAQAEVEFYRKYRSRAGVAAYTQLAGQKQAAAGIALNQVDQLKAALNQIDAELETIPSIDGVYQVDWFAVLAGRSKQGVPIFDLGLVSATPP
jgi:hypothetical protein